MQFLPAMHGVKERVKLVHIDRQDFLKTAAEACVKGDFLVHGWNRSELSLRRKGDPAKLAIANRLRRETVLSVPAIAEKLYLGSPKSARARLREQKLKNAPAKSQVAIVREESSYEDVALL